MMKIIGVIQLFALISLARSKSLPDAASVVSVYTTQPSTGAGNGTGLDVYQQIAFNLAEKISTPIYRFFGYKKNNNTTEEPKKLWQNLEILEDPYDDDLDKTTGRDIEELLNVVMNNNIPLKKPEKVTLYNAYLPTNGAIVYAHDNTNDDENATIINGWEFEDIYDPEVYRAREDSGPFIFALEWVGQLVQLAWGAISAVFQPST